MGKKKWIPGTAEQYYMVLSQPTICHANEESRGSLNVGTKDNVETSSMKQYLFLSW